MAVKMARETWRHKIFPVRIVSASIGEGCIMTACGQRALSCYKPLIWVIWTVLYGFRIHTFLNKVISQFWWQNKWMCSTDCLCKLDSCRACCVLQHVTDLSLEFLCIWLSSLNVWMFSVLTVSKDISVSGQLTAFVVPFLCSEFQ